MHFTKRKKITVRVNSEAVGTGFVTQEFSAIVESHRQQIFRFLLASSRDLDLAQTLTQECFLKAYRNWSNFRGDSSTKTWLIRIAINLQKDHWRSRSIQFWQVMRAHSVDLDAACEFLASGEISPEQSVLAREQVGKVWEGRRRHEGAATVGLFAALCMRYVEDLKVSEIALATGLNESTVKTHLYRALKIVRTELEAKGLTS